MTESGERSFEQWLQSADGLVVSRISPLAPGDTEQMQRWLVARLRAAFEAGRGGQSEAQKFLIKAVTRYANGYMQDEAHEREVCISDDQHEAAKDVFEALKMPAPPDSGDKKEAERG